MTENRNDKLSYLRAIACLAIVILHTVNIGAGCYGQVLTPTQSTYSHMAYNLMMWAVPCFLMVTGALLLAPERKVSYQKLYGRYILRIVLALVIFSLVYKVTDLVITGTPFTAGALADGFCAMLLGTNWVQLWYLYLLVGLYLLLPIYKIVADHIKARDLWYFLGIQVVFLVILPLLKIKGVESPFYIQTHTIYLFYVFFGFGAAGGLLKIKKSRAAAAFALGTLAIIGLTYWVGMVAPTAAGASTPNAAVTTGTDAANAAATGIGATGEAYPTVLFGYASIFVVLMACGLFAWVLGARTDTEKSPVAPGAVGRFLLAADDCSFGIYLVHIIFVRLVFYKWNIAPYAPGGAGTIAIYAGLVIAIFLISFAVTWALKKIPGVDRIL